LDEIHGREEVEAAGGHVLPMPFSEGKSTTNIVEKIRQLSES
jgi:bifunctional ADP-heptose synthase (sugar kinase/adenylyltransferase)